MNEDGFYKDGPYWRKTNYDGSNGKSDLIFNTCYKLLRDQDKSDWAYSAIEACSNLLLDGKRWSDRMSDDTDCKTWIQRIVNRSLRELGILKHPKFRYQGRMSRDPFIVLYTTALFLGVPEYIEAVPMPWYIYSRNTWRWRRRLIRDNRVDYVRRLGYLRSRAVVLSQSEFN